MIRKQMYPYIPISHSEQEKMLKEMGLDSIDTLFADIPDETRLNRPLDLPESHSEILRCVFESLAFKYRFILEQINAMVGNPVEVLHIVGGGSQNHQLNQFTAEATGIPVVAGPVEATAIGNVMVQAITTGLISDLEEARRVISKSFRLQRFEPVHHDLWDSRYRKIQHLLR